MHHTTGFSCDEVIDLCVLINSAEREPDFLKWPSILGLFKSVAATLSYMRRNRVQQELAETHKEAYSSHPVEVQPDNG